MVLNDEVGIPFAQIDTSRRKINWNAYLNVESIEV